MMQPDHRPRPDTDTDTDADLGREPGVGAAADPLAPWLAAARAELDTRLPPPWIEASLNDRLNERAALQALRRRPSPAVAAPLPWWRRWQVAAPLAAACALLLAFGVALQLPPAPLPLRAEGTPFIALASIEAIEAEPGKVVVPAELPRAALAHYGLPFDPARADQPARAELLVSPRGTVLAVRFVE